mmetsp:Transcript_18762/g.25877  ORF Transcript_18762/g.25877 Transcript_18762/m.25877 type:complete len:196 (+) Transcript_18762:477-1064(+)
MWENRVRVDTVDKLLHFIGLIESAGSYESLRSIYVFNGNESPTTSPEKTDVPSQKQDEISVKSSSENSKKTNETERVVRFRKALIIRDHEQCQICGVKQPHETPHIIDLESKMPFEEQWSVYKCCGFFVVQNGILLCRNCHTNYDFFRLGITSDGDVITNRGSWWVKIYSIVPIESILQQKFLTGSSNASKRRWK